MNKYENKYKIGDKVYLAKSHVGCPELWRWDNIEIMQAEVVEIHAMEDRPYHYKLKYNNIISHILYGETLLFENLEDYRPSEDYMTFFNHQIRSMHNNFNKQFLNISTYPGFNLGDFK